MNLETWRLIYLVACELTRVIMTTAMTRRALAVKITFVLQLFTFIFSNEVLCANTKL